MRWMVALTIVPVGFRTLGTELAVADFVAPVGLGWLFLRWSTLRQVHPELGRFARVATLVAALAVASWASIALFVPRVSPVATLLTMGFFLRSLLVAMVILGVVAIDPQRARSLFARTIVLVSLVLSSSAILSGGSIRREFRSDFTNGTVVQVRSTFFGYNLYGQGQVNSYSLYFSLAVAMAVMLAATRSQSAIWRLSAAVSGILSLYVVLQAGSRTGILFLLVYAALVMKRVGKNRVQAMGLPIVLVFTIVAIQAPSLLGLPSILSDRLAGLTAADVGNVEELSNGRLFQARQMMNDLSRSPLVGTGFFDFDLYHAGSLDVEGSPHNQWLGAAHKMGIPAGILYTYFFLLAALRSRTSLMSAALWAGIAACVVIDGVTVPVTAVLLSMIMAIALFAPTDSPEPASQSSDQTARLNQDHFVASGD